MLRPRHPSPSLPTFLPHTGHRHTAWRSRPALGVGEKEMSWVERSQAHTSPPRLTLHCLVPFIRRWNSPSCASSSLSSRHMLWTERQGRGEPQEEVKSQSPLTNSTVPCASASGAHTPHLCVLAMPSSGLGQAVPGLAAPRRAGAVGTDHVVGAIPETPLHTV